MDSMFNTPQEVVQANMNGAVKKAATSKKKVFFMGIMAGVCIALGAQSSNVAMHDISNVGLARLVAGCVGRSDDDCIYRRRIVHRRLYDDDGMY